MAPKHSADTAGVEKAKQRRSSLTLEEKLDILKRKEQGEGMSAIIQNLGLAQLTVWTVLKNHEAIKKSWGECNGSAEQTLICPLSGR
ncbi:hypothetical protein E2C01_048052 [Portunus trituberculatus]|uniref:HTH psq-type domain-containing protein n=1 Tax=Portunus trituberculatus TaxID=210409 RepID=A0A5B7G9N7_PORTR|nr:hypothetical protein [Portunus trituberculatus]